MEKYINQIMELSGNILEYKEASIICNRWIGKATETSIEEQINSIINYSIRKLSYEKAAVISKYLITETQAGIDRNNAEIDRILDEGDDDDFFNKISDFQRKQSSQGFDKDTLPGGIGEYGFDKRNPIPVNGIPAIKIYLSKLVTETGVAINWERIGSYRAENIASLIDGYRIFDGEGKEISVIYFSAYNQRMSIKAPKGFRLLIN